MAVYKRQKCQNCGKVIDEPKPTRKAPLCELCGSQTIYSDKWYVTVRLPDEHGRMRKRTRAVGTNKQFAIEYEGRLLGQRGDGECFESRKSVRLGKLAEAFLDDCEQRVKEGNLGKRTADFYRQMLENFVVPWFGEDRDVKKLTSDDVTAYKKSRMKAKRRVYVGGCKKKGGKTRELDRTIKPSTVNRELAALSAMLSFGMRQRGLRENVAKGVEALKEDNKKDRFLTPDEIDQLLAECRTPHLKMAVLLALEAGLRLANCLTIKWSEVNFQRNELVKVGKGRKEIRVPLTRKLKAALLSHQKAQKVKSIKGYVIPSPKKADEPMRVDADFGFTAAVKRAGVDDGFTFHDLRHTFVSLFLARTNGDIWTCSQIVGHSTTYMTERYGHLLDHRRREAMRQFEEG